MKRAKNHNPIRDFFLAVLLVFLIKPALHLSARRVQSEKNGSGCSFLTHELDPDIVRAFEVAENQLRDALARSILLGKVQVIQELEKLSQELASIKKRYTKNSPALFFLGPFGSMSIVLKELELEDKLTSIVDTLNKTLHKLAGSRPKPVPEEARLVANLKENERLLRESLRI